MKDDITSAYDLLGVSADYTDQQLRRAYLLAMKRHHPDVNHGDVATATAKTQRIIEAYSMLRRYQQRRAPNDSTATGGAASAQFRFKFDIAFDPTPESDKSLVAAITKRRNELREAFAELHAHPTSVTSALRAIVASIACEREDAIENLLTNDILIDSASLVYSAETPQTASETICVWEALLWGRGMDTESVAILEDALATGLASDQVKDRLRSRHYSIAQGYRPLLSRRTATKPEPAIRIVHLNRILELGYELDYVYKLLAEAYYEEGDRSTAVSMLTKAYALNPQLMGAVKISRALGFTEAAQGMSTEEALNDANQEALTNLMRTRSKRSRGERISVEQVRQWIAADMWNEIFALARSKDYRSQERSAMRMIARALGRRQEEEASHALVALTESWWDVRNAAYVSLAKIGDASCLDRLRSIRPGGGRESIYLQAAIEYISCRVNAHNTLLQVGDVERLIQLGQQAFQGRHYGQARFFLEQALEFTSISTRPFTELIAKDDNIWDTRLLLASACAEMGDQEHAIQVILPVLNHVPTRLMGKTYRELAGWLWSYLVFDPYESSNDHLYVQALEIHIAMVTSTGSASEFLYWIRHLTRWLELVGASDLIDWMRFEIVDAAPGYSEVRRNPTYVRDVQGSDALRSKLSVLESRLKAELPKKLREMFNTDPTLDARQLLLDE